MNRGEQRSQKMKARDQVRPEPGDCVEPVYNATILKRKSLGRKGLGNKPVLSSLG